MSIEKEQSESLMAELLEFGKKMLGTYGEFHPFAGYLTNDHRIVHIGLSPKQEGEWKSDKDRAEAISASLRVLARRERPLVVGIVTNVALPQGDKNSDAVRVFLEHRSGYCADVFFHYVLSGDVVVTSITAQQGVRTIYV